MFHFIRSYLFTSVLVAVSLVGCSSSSSSTHTLSYSVTNTGNAPLYILLGCGTDLDLPPSSRIPGHCKISTWTSSSLNSNCQLFKSFPDDSAIEYEIKPQGICQLSKASDNVSAGMEMIMGITDQIGKTTPAASCNPSFSPNPMFKSYGDYSFPTVSCHVTTSMGHLKITAEHALSPTVVSLSPLTPNPKQDLSSPKPVTLTPSNQFSSDLQVNDSVRYNVSVQPMIDSQDKIATFSHSLAQHTKSLVIDYAASNSKLVGLLPISTKDDLTKTPFNVLELTGLLNVDGIVNKTNLDTLYNMQFPAYVTPLVVLSQKDIPFLSTLLNTLPLDIKGFTIQVDDINKKLLNAVKVLHRAHPKIFIVLDLIKTPSASKLADLKIILEPTQHPLYPGWIQTPAKDISVVAPLIPASQLVINANTMKDTDLTKLLANYSSEPVNGLVLQPQQINDSNNIKQLVFKSQ